jgi:hypothetical protein
MGPSAPLPAVVVCLRIARHATAVTQTDKRDAYKGSRQSLFVRKACPKLRESAQSSWSCKTGCQYVTVWAREKRSTSCQTAIQLAWHIVSASQLGPAKTKTYDRQFMHPVSATSFHPTRPNLAALPQLQSNWPYSSARPLHSDCFASLDLAARPDCSWPEKETRQTKLLLAIPTALEPAPAAESVWHTAYAVGERISNAVRIRAVNDRRELLVTLSNTCAKSRSISANGLRTTAWTLVEAMRWLAPLLGRGNGRHGLGHVIPD